MFATKGIQDGDKRMRSPNHCGFQTTADATAYCGRSLRGSADSPVHAGECRAGGFVWNTVGGRGLNLWCGGDRRLHILVQKLALPRM